MRAMKTRRGGGSRFGSSGRAMLQGFLAENPDVAERFARFGVDQLRDDGWSDSEIREHFDHVKERGMMRDLDIDTILS